MNLPMSVSIDEKRAELLERYHQCSPTDQAAVNLLAVSWGGLSKSQITTTLRKVLSFGAATKINWDLLQRSGLIEIQKKWSGGQQFACNTLIAEPVTRELVASGAFETYVGLVRLAAPLQPTYLKTAKDDIQFRDDDELIREVRIGMYRGDISYIDQVFRMLQRMRFSYWNGLPQRWPDPAPIYALVCDNPFDREWFERLPAKIRESALPLLLLQQAAVWRLNPSAFDLLREACENPAAQAPEEWQLCRALLAIFRGELLCAQSALSGCALGHRERSLRGLLSLVQGDQDQALRGFQEALSLLRKEQNRRKVFLPGAVGIFFVLALSQRRRSGDQEEAQRLTDAVPEGHPFRPAYLLLGYIPALERNQPGALDRLNGLLAQLSRTGHMGPWEVWIALWLLHHYGSEKQASAHLPQAQSYQQQAAQCGYGWLAAEMAALIAQINPRDSETHSRAEAFEQAAGIRLLVNRTPREEAWERALNAIKNTVGRPPVVSKDEGAEYRLAWLLSRDRASYLGFALEAREQKRNASGGWTKGKTLSMKKVVELAELAPYFSERDRRVAAHIAPNRYTNIYAMSNRAWLAMIGAPAVHWKDSGVAVELVAAEPELRVRKKANGERVRIEFWPLCDEDESVVLAEDGLTRLKIVELKPEHHRLAQIIGKGIDAPVSAQERILASLGAVSALVTIHSDIGGSELAAAETVDADARAHVQLIPEGEGLRVAVLTRPFGEQGSYFVPGSGGASLIAEIGGKRLQTRRDLELERRLADELIASCPSLADHAEEVTAYQWLLGEAETSLEFLLELHEMGDRAQIEWPQGEKLKVLGQAGLSQFSIKVKQQRDWFSVSGELTLDDGQVLNMQRLLELTEGAKGKFIRLDEGHFLALTEAFKKRLDDLRAYSEKHGKDYRLHALALPAMEEMAEEVGEFQGDSAWRAQLERLRHAETVQPKLPSTLQAELRDYQRDGFEWLSRLAAWGVGACLADDMGLGKTLQALALILSQSGEGPSLVVAPTSVCMNWQSEAARFAPALNVQVLGGGDREKLIGTLRPMDLLICSYALLQQESVGELLAGPVWQTIVLDEAQLIKNPATKRSQQAMALQGRFKIITTGTPVENHLGELWNLFRFINPGLLGSLESFNRRFAGPIERNQDREARQRLKKLIQPFILRRTKSQVLDELPPRTEIELHVELSEQESLFYEALRRKLLTELNETHGPAEDKRFQVMVAITKLRRACCNAQLVAPELGLPSSKLALFGEVVEELLDNRHKALVFSQFVDHLTLIRAFLDEKRIAYQYLDGQTPPAERKKRVDAFQAGQGEVFLISLKAGGVGLNLTAADYVIHMDPWWNPAVEDQASDRAHRIGQQRPVTVYRLVTKNTIEEQIVSLHRHKRDLANSVLEGGEISGKISAEDLLKLIELG
ncbi:MAG: DEAD/DEAH box helicase [Methylotetracoccus sp.]|nr:DEAD/DEAH box helicase [Methylotetracoccus sp.]